MSDTETTPAISASDIRCGYDETVVLDKVSFDVSMGEVFFIIGGSGCGKSTLLRNMIGIHRPQAGRDRNHLHLRWRRWSSPRSNRCSPTRRSTRPISFPWGSDLAEQASVPSLASTTPPIARTRRLGPPGEGAHHS